MRRRLPWRRRNQLDLITGESFISAPDSSLLLMFDEIWITRRYLPAAWGKRDRPTVVDVGANVGVFAIWARRVLKSDRLIVIEPSPRTVGTLRQNLARNGVSSVSVMQVAVAGRRGTSTLYRRGRSSLNTLFQRDRYGSRFEPDAEVSLVTLDDVLHECRLDRCDLLKLDCEGAEYEILFGASDESLARIDHIVGEYHEGMTPYGRTDLQAFLEGHGFDVTCFPPDDEEGGHFHATRHSR